MVNPPLFHWQRIAVRGEGNALNWNGTLLPIGTSPTAPASAEEEIAHAQSLGRNPFAISGGVNVAGVQSSTPSQTPSTPKVLPLPSESQWPKPSVRDWPVSSLRMVGVLGERNRQALLMAGERAVYVVGIGERIGREGKRIIGIHGDAVEFDGSRMTRAPVIVESVR